MKKIFLVVIIILTLVAMPATIYLVSQKQEFRKKAAPASTISLIPANLNPKVGEIFTLEATIDTADNQVLVADIQIEFDSTKLEAQSITNGALFPNILTAGTIENGKATILVGAPSTTQPVRGKGTAAILRFKALDVTTSPITVKFSPNTFAGAQDEGSNNVLIGTNPSVVTITDGAGGNDSTTPSETPEPSQSPEPTSPDEEPTDTPQDGDTPTGITKQSPTPAGEAGADSTNENEPLTNTQILSIDSPALNSNAKSNKPEIKGKAPPGSSITLTIYSTPKTIVLTADQNGNWIYTPDSALEEGPHNVVASFEDPDTGETYSATSSFVIAAGTSGGSPDEAIPVAGNASYTLILLIAGVMLLSAGFFIPLVFR